MAKIAVDNTELIWAAGLFDGEGSIFAFTRNDNKYTNLFMGVSMCDKEPVGRFTKAVNVGKVVTLNRRTTTGKLVYRWRIASDHDVYYAFGLIEPFLSSPKAEQAYKAFAKRESAIRKLSYGKKGGVA